MDLYKIQQYITSGRRKHRMSQGNMVFDTQVFVWNTCSGCQAAKRQSLKTLAARKVTIDVILLWVRLIYKWPCDDMAILVHGRFFCWIMSLLRYTIYEVEEGYLQQHY